MGELVWQEGHFSPNTTENEAATSNASCTEVSTNSVAASRPFSNSWCWFLGLGLGIATQLVFLFTVVQLFMFLRFGAATIAVASENWMYWDFGLAVGFVIPHSILLVPSVQQWMRQRIPAAWTGCIHCCVTCVSLLTIFSAWRTTEGGVWLLTGWWRDICVSCFYGSWVTLFYSLALTGLGYQTGWTPWINWIRQRRQPKRTLVTHGAYRLLRHPVYLSFLGLIWFTPHMTWDHVILTGVWTVYIFVGSIAKDRRLLHYVGDEYREYARRVPGYPLLGWGTLGKWQD
ncbi:MAG: hypothetical protein KDB03_12120 [Planctomycetales bacterium]|nr:hypothetical protein [Planctomycetales bacterium]